VVPINPDNWSSTVRSADDRPRAYCLLLKFWCPKQVQEPSERSNPRYPLMTRVRIKFQSDLCAESQPVLLVPHSETLELHRTRCTMTFKFQDFRCSSRSDVGNLMWRQRPLVRQSICFYVT